MCLVPLGALAALGGAYPRAAVPLLVASAAAFAVSRARIAAPPERRALDACLAGVAAAVLVQVVPLPSPTVAAISPHAAALQQLVLYPPDSVRTLSIDARLTRLGLATLASALLVFWAAREVFAHGGVRVAARAVAWAGFAAALVGLAQRATAPGLLLWRWRPIDPGAQPFGPFVNRNHFAGWLLLASALTAGYLVAHMRAHGVARHGSRRLLARDLLRDGGGLLLAGALGMMLLALAASASRAALLGAGAALVFGLAAARRRGAAGARFRVAAAAMVLLLAGAVFANRDALARRVDATIDGRLGGRAVIWRETAPIVGDFWIAGTGLGTYGHAMLQYQRTDRDRLFNHAHNELLQLLAEGGVLLAVPAALAALAWARLARRRIAADRSELSWVRLGAAAGVCGFAVQSLFEAALRMPANALLLALLAALAVYERHPDHGDPP